MSSSQFAKRERERLKRERAERKRERKEERKSEAADAPESAPVAEADVLAQLQALHEDLDAERITFDEFEASKAELLARLQV